MNLIVYGDFNCPYSALASARVDKLLRAGGTDIEWRAVQHDADMPADGLPIEGDRRVELEREIDEVLGVVRDGESFDIKAPVVRPNTARASRVYAARPGAELRQRLFAWAWGQADEPESSEEDTETAGRWQREWDAIEKKMVPLLVLPDGYISRGLGALKRLADMAVDRSANDIRT